MSTVLPDTPSQKSKEQILGFLGGTQGRRKARIMSISRALGQKSQPPNALESWKLHGRTPWRKSKLQNVEENAYGGMLPVAASPKKGGRARAGFFLFIYLSISTYLSRYNKYVSLSLSF